MQPYSVTPYDVLFFRDNKSFTFGLWHTEGVFPPYPSTFQGFVRSKILTDNNLLDDKGKINDVNCGRANKLVGDDYNLRIGINGPYLRDSENDVIYFVRPSDLLRETGDCKGFHSVLAELKQDFESDLPFKLVQPKLPDGKLDKLYPPQFISEKDLIKHLTTFSSFEISSPRQLVYTEDRVGIKLIVDKRKVEETKFYVTPYERFRQELIHEGKQEKMRVGLYFETDAKEIKHGSLTLGSESHLVYVGSLADHKTLKNIFSGARNILVEAIKETSTFRMILLQPGIFEFGWLPFQCRVDEKTQRLSLDADGIELILLYAFIDSPIKIGGYSLDRNRGAKKWGDVKLKPMQNAVPAGSVYLFHLGKKMTDKQITTFVDKYYFEKIDHKPYSDMGFNQIVLGVGPRFKLEGD